MQTEIYSVRILGKIPGLLLLSASWTGDLNG
jgi:hypothetical protein